MKSQSFIPINQQAKSVKHLVIKGSQNIPYDANVMAQIQMEKSYHQQLLKKNKIQSFLNSTKFNASKIYKQKYEQTNSIANNKKALLQKQKDLKSKYTIVKKTDTNKLNNEVKKTQSTKNIKNQPTKIQWKKSPQSINADKVKIPQEKLHYQNDSDEDNLSQIDSDIDQQRESNPNDMLKIRQSVRNSMLNKFNTKK